MAFRISLPPKPRLTAVPEPPIKPAWELAVTDATPALPEPLPGPSPRASLTTS